MLLGNLSLPASAQDLIWSGTLAMVADDHQWTAVVSTLNPLNPT